MDEASAGSDYGCKSHPTSAIFRAYANKLVNVNIKAGIKIKNRIATTAKNEKKNIRDQVKVGEARKEESQRPAR